MILDTYELLTDPAIQRDTLGERQKMKPEIEAEIERVLQQWRAEPITIVTAAKIAMAWAYRDAAQICMNVAERTTDEHAKGKAWACAQEIEERAKP